MKYAIVASAWLFAWGAVAPQQAAAGLVFSVQDVAADGDAVSAGNFGARGSAANADVAPQRDRRELSNQLDHVFGVLQAPSGGEVPASSSGSYRTTSIPLSAVVGDEADLLLQSSGGSVLPPDKMFTVSRLFKSGVFRPPRA